MEYNLTKEYAYKDIMLIPKRCSVKSRSECDTSCKLGNYTFKSPVVPSNMPAIINDNTCEYLANNEWFYINHRFNKSKEDYLDFIRRMRFNEAIVSVSVGVNQDSYEVLRYIKQNNEYIDYCTIDIAHGHCDKMIDMIKFIRDTFPDCYIIAGNVCTGEAVKELELAGACGVKVGIGQGKVCLTKNKTGFTRPMVNTVIECVAAAQTSDIIADGGIQEIGDIVKSLALGAKMVMCGSLFSGYKESAGEFISIDNKQYKYYYGSASEYNKNEKKHIEGMRILVEYKGEMNCLLSDIIDSIKSGISYSGGNTVEDLQFVKKILIT